MTVTLSGDLDLVTAPALSTILEQAPDRAVAEVRVVMGDVTFMDSTGLSALVRGWQAARKAGVRFRVTNASPAVRRVLAITGMEALLDGDGDGDGA